MSTKPIDEAWQHKALSFVRVFRKRFGHGPTWAELWAEMGWNRKRTSGWFMMLKLRKRGLTWADGERTLDVTDDGKTAIADYLQRIR